MWQTIRFRHRTCTVESAEKHTSSSSEPPLSESLAESLAGVAGVGGDGVGGDGVGGDGVEAHSPVVLEHAVQKLSEIEKSSTGIA